MTESRFTLQKIHVTIGKWPKYLDDLWFTYIHLYPLKNPDFHRHSEFKITRGYSLGSNVKYPPWSQSWVKKPWQDQIATGLLTRVMRTGGRGVQLDPIGSDPWSLRLCLVGCFKH